MALVLEGARGEEESLRDRVRGFEEGGVCFLRVGWPRHRCLIRLFERVHCRRDAREESPEERKRSRCYLGPLRWQVSSR